MPLNVVLVEPEIPQNTGNIARTCVVTGSHLHIVKPMGFSLDEKHIRRAGLDYWKDLTLHVYESMQHFYDSNPDAQLWYFSSKVPQTFSEVSYNGNAYLVFGNETAGLREKMPADKIEQCVRIPMMQNQRCLNLSNAVCVAVYEVLRQTGYPNLV